MYIRRQKHRPTCYICSSYAKHGADVCQRNSIAIEFLAKTVASELYNRFSSLLAETMHFSETERRILPVHQFNGFNINCNSAINGSAKKVDNDCGQISAENAEQLKRKQEAAYSDMLDGKISEDLFSRINQIIENKLSQMNVKNETYNCFDIVQNKEYYAKQNRCDYKICNSILALLLNIAQNGLHFLDEQNGLFFAEVIGRFVNKIVIFADVVKIYYIL